MTRLMAAALLCAAALAPSAAPAPQGQPLPAACWPRFRGLDGAGLGAGKLPATWGPKQNIAWVANLPGKGWSSPIVWGNRVFVTTAIAGGAAEPPTTPAKMEDNAKGVATSKLQRWAVVCLDFRNGRILWQREAARAVPDWLIHPKGSHASETPVTDGERVYALFGNVGLFCYTVDGKPLWSRRWGPHKMLFNWGTAAGPAVHDGRVFVVNDNEEKSVLWCLDAKTGKDLWTVDRTDEKSNWCTPLIWRNSRRTELVTAGSKRVRSYDLDGKLLWSLQGMSYATIPSPFAVGNTLYISSGHASGPIRPIYAVRAGASGDISLAKDQKSSASIAWCQPAAGPYVPTPIAMDAYVYALTDVSGLFCYRADDGTQVYRQRIPGAGQFTASPVAGDGKLYCLGEKGQTYVVQAGPEFKVLAENRLDEDSLATPAIAGTSLLIRTLKKLYRIEDRP